MVSKASNNPVTSQVTLIVLALAAFSLAMLVGFGFFATLETDRNSLAKQKAFVAAGIADETAELIRQQTSVSLWDDSVLAARNRDQAWMTDNLGQWIYDYYGIDRVYVLDPSGSPVHAMQDGATLAVTSYEDDRAVVEAAVARLRDLAHGAAPNDSHDSPVVTDLVTIGGRPAILSVQPLLPNSNRVMQEAGQEYIHVAIQGIDDTLVGRIARKYQLNGMHLLPQLTSALPGASIPLIGSSGAILGYVTWNQERPGLDLVRQASPAFLGFCLLAAGVLWFLLRRLRRTAGELQQSQEQTQYIAFHDALTGLPNRALFEDRLKRALFAVSRDGRKIGLLYVDLDRFKTVNDTFGHPVGDELVRQTAARLQDSVRQVDTVARLGGDEFAVVIFDVKDLVTAEELCQRLLGEISRPFDLLGNQVYIDASIGVAISDGPATDPGELLRKADIALYEAKKAGGSRHEVFAGGMDDLLAHKRVIEADMRGALSGGGGMKLVYQPIYAPDCKTVVGAEALIRWDHPVHGALSPSHFVSIADERGMTGLLGDWVLENVARFAAGSNLPWIAFNVSPLQLRDASFANRVVDVFQQANVAPEKIQIEIVESALLENCKPTQTALSTLRGAGFRIVLDDFGTGYSSINYLKRYIIDKLKIDRSFVRMLGGTEGTAIVKAIIELATTLKVKITAEGVETPEQRDLLIQLGCHELQGFLLSPPLEAGEMEVRSGKSLSRQRSATGT
ncbi:MAG: bifunctional diguanylate cyclase/phosphodiesterase [Mesorhizobium sp.]|nr:bifunctional diguanylate cyclase/phosphodiesterase [Mesorhizobium sp.]MBL8580130.1 bifunctional diguanylate cyclase/phosphodiesterase [Mesorhizobium sp.]